MIRSIFTSIFFLSALYVPFGHSHTAGTHKKSYGAGQRTAHHAISLLNVFQMASQNNAAIAAARATYKAEREVVAQARSPLFPQISVGANTTYNKNTFPDKPTNKTNPNRWNTNGWSTSINQSLFDLSNIFNLKAAYKKEHIAKLKLEMAEQKLIYDVASAYFSVLKAQDDKASAEAHLRSVKKQLSQTEERYKVGMLANTDVQEAKAAYDTAKVSVIQIENAITVAKENLSLLTNQPVPELYKLNQKMPTSFPKPGQLSVWEKWAITYNLMVQQAKQDVYVSQYELSAAHSSFSPVLSGSVSYARAIDNEISARLNNQRRSNSLTATLSVSIPFFSGGGDYSKAKAAGYALEAKQKTEDEVMRQAKIDVHNYYNTVHADIAQIKAWCQSIVSAASSLRATESGYQVGTRTVIDVLNGQDTLYNAQKQYLDSRYNFILNTLKLKQASGTLSQKDLQYLNHWMTHPDHSSDSLTPYCSTTEGAEHEK